MICNDASDDEKFKAYTFLSLMCLADFIQVRIMKKRLVRKTFDMIQDLSECENKEVWTNQSILSFSILPGRV